MLDHALARLGGMDQDDMQRLLVHRGAAVLDEVVDGLYLGVRHWLVGELNDGTALHLWRPLHRAVLHQRARRGSTTGIATGCIGVGQGLALVLER